VLTMTERPSEPQAHTVRLLRCKKRSCDTLLARIVGVSLVCLDGTRVGPLVPGQVISRRCVRCKLHNLYWV
jgi:hypothetical protein